MAEQSQTNKRVVYRRAAHTADLDKMRLNGELCDVTIKTTDKEFRAHKVILAAGIKYFHTMFLSNFRESTQNVVNITAVNEANLESLIAFAYTGKITLTDDNVLSLLEDVDYLNMDDVKEACVGFLRANLTAEQALKTYRFASSINNVPLKQTAIQMMLKDFEKTSHGKEFLDLEFYIVEDILSADTGHTVKTQSFFEGIVRWLIHDMRKRAMHATDLLCRINIADLTADYLIAYLYEKIDAEHDAMIRTIISFYRVRTKRKPLVVSSSSNPRQRLIVINRAMLSHVQYFDFDKNEWTFCYTNVDHLQYAESVVSHNKLYIIGGKNDVRCLANVTVFDPQKGVYSSVAPMSVARRDCAVCSSVKHLYVCGGRSSDGTDLNHVERYNVASDTWETLSPLNTARSNAAAVLFQGNIYVIGGTCKGTLLTSVERYSPGVKRWVIVDSLHYPRASLAATTLNEKLYVCGESSVEMFDPRVKKWQLLASMQKKRNSFLLVAYDGKLMAVGGDTTQSGPTSETYDPNTNEWTLILSPGFHIKYLMGGLINT